MTPKLPFMPFYGADFYESETVKLMDRAERSMYLELLWHQWREGSLPGDPTRVALLLNEAQVNEWVLTQFKEGPDGRRRNARLEEIRALHELIREQKSEAGKRGAEARWHGKTMADGKQADGSAIAVPRQADGIPDTRDQIPERTTPSTRAREEGDAPSRWSQVTAELGELGRSALEGYRHASRNPDRLLDELLAVLSGLHGPGGRAVTPEQLGRALHDMSVAGVEMSSRRLRAFVQGVLDGDPPPRANGRTHAEDDTPARMERWADRKAREQEAQRARQNS